MFGQYKPYWFVNTGKEAILVICSNYTDHLVLTTIRIYRSVLQSKA